EVSIEPDLCPASDRSTVAVSVSSNLKAPLDGDPAILQLTLESTSNPKLEREVRSLAAGTYSFPVTVGFNQLEPGTYIVSTCFDAAGDETCDPSDATAAVSSAFEAVAAEVVRVSLDLESGTGSVEDSKPPSKADCSSGTVTAEVSGTTVSVGSGDRLILSLFEGTPSQRQPEFSNSVEVEDLPVTISVNALPGEYSVVLCYRRGDSPSEFCDGPEDILVVVGGFSSTITVEENETTNLTAELTP
ncbi:MAG: hypothetical protein AAF550_04500, partial [Myxococcota bacterium]